MTAALHAFLVYPHAKDLQVIRVICTAFPQRYDVVKLKAVGVQDKALTLRARWVLCPEMESAGLQASACHALRVGREWLGGLG